MTPRGWLVHRETGTCLAPDAVGSAGSAPLDLVACQSLAPGLAETPWVHEADEGWIKGTRTGKCLTPTGTVPDDGAVSLASRSCLGANPGDGTWRWSQIRNELHGKCLSTAPCKFFPGLSEAQGACVIQADCRLGGVRQQWRLGPLGALLNQGSGGRCATLSPGGGAEGEAHLAVVPCADARLEGALFGWTYDANTRSYKNTNSGQCLTPLRGAKVIAGPMRQRLYACADAGSKTLADAQTWEAPATGLDQLIGRWTFVPARARAPRPARDAEAVLTQDFTQIPDSALAGHNDETFEQQTVAGCAEKCAHATRPWCVSFDYTKATRRCDLSRVGPWDVPNAWAQNNVAYEHYFKEMRRAPGWATSAEILARDFTRVEDSALAGYNHETFEKQTIAECAMKCADPTRPWCTSFDFTKATKRCDLSRVGPWEVPNAWVQGKAAYTHYYKTEKRPPRWAE